MANRRDLRSRKGTYSPPASSFACNRGRPQAIRLQLPRHRTRTWGGPASSPCACKRSRTPKARASINRRCVQAIRHLVPNGQRCHTANANRHHSLRGNEVGAHVAHAADCPIREGPFASGQPECSLGVTVYRRASMREGSRRIPTLWVRTSGTEGDETGSSRAGLQTIRARQGQQQTGLRRGCQQRETDGTGGHRGSFRRTRQGHRYALPPQSNERYVCGMCPPTLGHKDMARHIPQARCHAIHVE